MISLICAMDRSGLIGLDNSLPWHRPADLKNFARLTTGHTVVMGRNTFKSIGNPLLDRYNVILSRKISHYLYDDPNIYMINSIDRCLDFLNYEHEINPDMKVFIIGGRQIYKVFAPYVERMYITVINEKIQTGGCEATYFPWPVFSKSSWSCVEQKMLGPDFYYVFDRKGINNEKTKVLLHPTS